MMPTRRISIPEYGKINRQDLGQTLVSRLQKFDELYSREQKSRSIFDWSRVHYIRATSYVGVIQVPGLIVEILPKVDISPAASNEPYADKDPQKDLAQRNLLYMLAFTKKIPIQHRDLASLSLQRLPLLEALMRIFAERLWTELRKGLPHGYVHREENARFLRGKLLVAEQIRRNAIHQERVYVSYDEFVADTWLNRILKAACHKILDSVVTIATEQLLREILLYLADVEDVPIEAHHFEKVHLDRNTERFEPLLEFARVVLLEKTPAPSIGGVRTFSLLFPMERLFEEFIARFVRRYCVDLGVEPSRLHIQAAHRRRWLLLDEQKSGKFCLKPDILIDGEHGPELILDTKWKRLKTTQEDVRNGVAQSDIYQLYAYSQQYEAKINILLFPQIEGLSRRQYTVEGRPDKQIRIEFVDVSRDLVKHRDELKADLRRILATT